MSNLMGIDALVVLTSDADDNPMDAMDISLRVACGTGASGHILAPDGGVVLVAYVPPDEWPALAATVDERGSVLAAHMRSARLDDALDDAVTQQVGG